MDWDDVHGFLRKETPEDKKAPAAMANDDVIERVLRPLEDALRVAHKCEWIDIKVHHLRDAVEALRASRARVAELEQDARRLDFILKHCWISFPFDGELSEKPVSDLEDRSEIDAAMAVEGCDDGES